MYASKLIKKSSKNINKSNNNKPNNNNQHNNNQHNNEEKDDYYGSYNVSTIENHIYFYAPVNTESILELNKQIQTLNESLSKTKLDIQHKFNSELNLKIYLHINSLGGYIFDALAAVDTIKNSKIPIISIVEGCAASAATLLSIVAKERQIRENASILIHQLSGGTWGTYEQMKDDNINNIYLQEKMKEIYLNHSKNKLKEKTLKKCLKRDIWWDPKKCKKLGLVDTII